jgi:hypothetical protein
MSLLAQIQPDDTSTAAATVFGVVALVGILSILALLSRSRRSLLPLVGIAIGVLIAVSTIHDATTYGVNALTAFGVFFSVMLLFGSVGALREGVTLPQVEGTDPDVPPAPPRVTPGD